MLTRQRQQQQTAVGTPCQDQGAAALAAQGHGLQEKKAHLPSHSAASCPVACPAYHCLLLLPLLVVVAAVAGVLKGHQLLLLLLVLEVPWGCLVGVLCCLGGCRQHPLGRRRKEGC